MSTMRGQTQFDNIMPGGVLGAYMNFGVDQPLYFRLEANIASKGVRNWSGIEGFSDSRLNTLYGEVLLCFGIELTRKITVNLGFQPSILMLAHHRYTLDEESFSGRWGEQMTLMDYATVMGLQYAISEKYQVGARYHHSFFPVQKRGELLDKVQQEPAFMTLQLFLCYRLN